MVRVDPFIRHLLLGLAIVAGGCFASSIHSFLLPVPDLLGSLIGMAFLLILAAASRKVLREVDSFNPYKRAVVICRSLPIALRCVGAIGILVTFLFYDRFLDGDQVHFSLFSFIAPIMIATALFDLKPGLLSVAASALAFDFFLVPPFGSFVVHTYRDTFELAAYAGAATLIAFAIQLALNEVWRNDKNKCHIEGVEPVSSDDLYKLFGIQKD